ncbi:MAG: isoamylase early set domain-containing protein [Stygiobacter sp.]|jgi:1,4-alpha-glucan branching enzyme
MAIKKEYSQDKNLCKVTFILPKEINGNFNEISVVGDFNNWDHHQHKFTHKNSDGTASLEITLESQKEYKFRYLCDGQIWLNEPEADAEELTHFGDSKNSVLII